MSVLISGSDVMDNTTDYCSAKAGCERKLWDRQSGPVVSKRGQQMLSRVIADRFVSVGGHTRDHARVEVVTPRACAAFSQAALRPPVLQS